MRFEDFSFGSIRIDGVTYKHDVVIDRGEVRKRKKKLSKRFQDDFGHTPISIGEDLPWKCRRLVVGTGAYGMLPVMDEVKREAKRRKVELLLAPTAKAIEALRRETDDTNAVLHVTCDWRFVSPIIPWISRPVTILLMRDLVVLFIHFIATLARLLGPGGARSIVAESLLLKHQLLILNRSRRRSPNLSVSDRILAGLMALLVRPTRLLRSAIVLKPSTLLGLHQALSQRRYRMLFSPNRRRKPGPKGPSAELIHAVVDMKQPNPRWGCPRIAQQIALAFHIQIDKDVVRRILAHHRWPGQGSGGPSWLTFLGHMKDSLWSIDLFRCESATLRTHWVLVIMDQYTRQIIGFGVHAGTVDGVALCRMFNRALREQLWMPKYLSSDHDPLYKFHQWRANLRILEVTEIKSVPCVPLSHPFVERLIGTIRREYLDHTLFWTTADLENKLLEFRNYFNHHRTHTSRDGQTPDTPASRPVANLRSFRWQPHCRGLYQTPVAA